MSSIDITARIGGRGVPRAGVLAWEAGRAAKVLKKLGATIGAADVDELRRAHVARKLELGHEGLERLLARDLRRSATAGRIGVAIARGRRSTCAIELVGTGASVEHVPDWYREAIGSNNEVPLI